MDTDTEKTTATEKTRMSDRTDPPLFNLWEELQASL